MHAVPDIREGKTTKRGEKSRFEHLGDAALMPPNDAPHLIDWLLEIGPLSPEGGSLAWRDLAAWQEITGIVLEPWEARLLRRLSGDFAAMRIKGEKHDCPPPYAGDEEVIASNRDNLAAKVKSMFGGRLESPRR